MSRVPYFFLVVTAALLSSGEVAFCLSPDQVRGSKIPCPQEPRPQPSTFAERGAALVSFSPLTNFRTPDSTAHSSEVSPQDRYEALTTDAEQAEEYRDKQREIWESPEMLEARSYVAEFCRLSARTSPTEGEQFLTQLSQLSPSDMQAWLERYLARRQTVSQERAVGDLARQVQLEQAIEQQQATRRVYSHVKQLQRDFAAANPGGFPTVIRNARQLRMGYTICDSCNPSRACVLTGSSSLSAAAYLNQMNSPYYAGAAGAAATAPGDMLRRDPRNLMRGDISDFNGAATEQNSLPVGPDRTFSLPAAVPDSEASAADDALSGR